MPQPTQDDPHTLIARLEVHIAYSKQLYGDKSSNAAFWQGEVDRRKKGLAKETKPRKR